MNAHAYAEALYLAAQGKDDAEQDRLVSRLCDLLRARKHEALLPAILREYEKLTHERRASGECTVRVARTTDRDTYTASIAKDMMTLAAGTLPTRVVVDPRAIGGYEVRALGKRIDRTHKRSLIDLYQTLISNS